jgi:hypothetical protein
MMLRTLIAVPILTVALAGTASAGPWRCDIDLHQGDTGRIEFTLSGSDLSGTITVNRGGVPQTSQVAGTWTGETITFTRTLSPATTIQPFRGVAVDGGDGRTKMAGRFAAGFEGIWSAACAADAGPGPGPGRGRGAAGAIAGTDLAVSPARGGACSISGTVTGSRAPAASAFSVVLYGPDSLTLLHARQPLGSGRFRFADLPDGRYVLATDTKADVAVNVTPRRQVVVCKGAAIDAAPFRFE